MVTNSDTNRNSCALDMCEYSTIGFYRIGIKAFDREQPQSTFLWGYMHNIIDFKPVCYVWSFTYDVEQQQRCASPWARGQVQQPCVSFSVVVAGLSKMRFNRWRCPSNQRQCYFNLESATQQPSILVSRVYVHREPQSQAIVVFHHSNCLLRFSICAHAQTLNNL